MTKFYVLCLTWTTVVNVSYFHLEINAEVAYLAYASCRAISLPNRYRQSRVFLIKYKFICPGVDLVVVVASLLKLFELWDVTIRGFYQVICPD